MADQEIGGGGAFSNYEDYKLGYFPSTRTAQDIWGEVTRTFGDESGVQIQQGDVIAWINNAQDDIVNKNRILKTRAFTYSVAGIREYQYPSTYIEQVESLHYDGQVLPGLSFTQAEQALTGKDQNAQGAPEFWYEWGGAFSLYPTPASPAPITLYYTDRPTPVSTLSDVLSIPDKYYQAVLQYCLQQAYELDEDWQASGAKSQQYKTLTDQLGEEERTSQRMQFQVRTLVDDEW